jgi:hypothetical protein
VQPLAAALTTLQIQQLYNMVMQQVNNKQQADTTGA